MVLLLNRLNQPLPVNLKQGESIHFLAREEREIELEQLESPEIKNHIEVGNILVLRMD